MRVVSKYEVACPSCRVSYPVGQKVCVHCGGRTGPSVVEMPDVPLEISSGVGTVTREPEPGPLAYGDEMVFAPAGRETDDEETPGGSVLRRLGGLTWLLIFVVVTVLRACFGEE
jgi:hypothetical protein